MIEWCGCRTHLDEVLLNAASGSDHNIHQAVLHQIPASSGWAVFSLCCSCSSADLLAVVLWQQIAQWPGMCLRRRRQCMHCEHRLRRTHLICSRVPADMRLEV